MLIDTGRWPLLRARFEQMLVLGYGLLQRVELRGDLILRLLYLEIDSRAIRLVRRHLFQQALFERFARLAVLVSFEKHQVLLYVYFVQFFQFRFFYMLDLLSK